MFLNNQLVGVEVGWNVSDTEDCGRRVSNQRLLTRQRNHLIFLLTFGFAWSSSDIWRAFLDVDYITSLELGNLVWVGIIHHVHLTYVLWSVQLNIYSSADFTYPRWHTQQLGQQSLRVQACQREARREPRLSSEIYRLGDRHWACGLSSVRDDGVTGHGTQSEKFRRAIVVI